MANYSAQDIFRIILLLTSFKIDNLGINLPFKSMNNNLFRTIIQSKITMQLKNFSAVLGILFLSANFCFSQSSASIDSKFVSASSNENFTIGNDEWAFYLDAESKVYYIDFESISVNLSDIKIVNSNGEVVLTDKLWDLPVNTIYEVDLKGLNPGKYKIELRSYTGLIQKDVVVAE